jgi:hypothetical protein
MICCFVVKLERANLSSTHDDDDDDDDVQFR